MTLLSTLIRSFLTWYKLQCIQTRLLACAHAYAPIKVKGCESYKLKQFTTELLHNSLKKTRSKIKSIQRTAEKSKSK